MKYKYSSNCFNQLYFLWNWMKLVLHDCLKIILMFFWKAKTVPFHIETAENPVCLTQKRSHLTLKCSLMDSVQVYQKHGCMSLPITFFERSKLEKWRFSTSFDTLPWAVVWSQLLISDKINWRNLSKLCTSILPIWQIGLLKVCTSHMNMFNALWCKVEINYSTIIHNKTIQKTRNKDSMVWFWRLK